MSGCDPRKSASRSPQVYGSGLWRVRKGPRERLMRQSVSRASERAVCVCVCACDSDSAHLARCLFAAGAPNSSVGFNWPASVRVICCCCCWYCPLCSLRLSGPFNESHVRQCAARALGPTRSDFKAVALERDHSAIGLHTLSLDPVRVRDATDNNNNNSPAGEGPSL